MAFEKFEQRMERACKEREIPGAIIAGGDSKGMGDPPNSIESV